MLLDKSAIFNADDSKTEDIEIPEWGGTVRVKAMTYAQRTKYLNSITKDENGEVNDNNIMAKLVIASVIDENGNYMFSNGDMNQLTKKNSSIIDRIGLVATNLAGLKQEKEEDAVKN